MASSGYTAITFVANEQPTTAKWNLIGSNDASFNNGNGFEDGIIVNRHLAAGAVTSDKINFDKSILATRSGSLSINSNTYVNVTSASVSTVVGASGKVLLAVGGYIDTPSSANVGLFLRANLTGANVFDTDGTQPSDNTFFRAGSGPNPTFFPLNAAKVITGLTPGTTLFQLQARLAGGGGSCSITNGWISVTPL